MRVMSYSSIDECHPLVPPIGGGGAGGHRRPRRAASASHPGHPEGHSLFSRRFSFFNAVGRSTCCRAALSLLLLAAACVAAGVVVVATRTRAAAPARPPRSPRPPSPPRPPVAATGSGAVRPAPAVGLGAEDQEREERIERRERRGRRERRDDREDIMERRERRERRARREERGEGSREQSLITFTVHVCNLPAEYVPWQGLTLVHFSAQPEPLLAQNTPWTAPDTP